MTITTRALLGFLSAVMVCASAARAQDEWPPNFSAQTPCTGQNLEMTFSGTWHDSCVPRIDSVVVSAGRIDVHMSHGGIVCLPVVSNYSVTHEMSVPMGTYQVFADLSNQFGQPERPSALAGMVVVPCEAEWPPNFTAETTCTAQNLHMMFSGTWHDSCVPRIDSVAVTPGRIDVRMSHGGFVCLPVISNYSLTHNMTIAPGTYEVFADLSNQFGQPEIPSTLLGSVTVPTCCPADIATTGEFQPPFHPDGQLNGADFDAFIASFFLELRREDQSFYADIATTGQFEPPFTPDGQLSGADFDAFILLFFTGCD